MRLWKFFGAERQGSHRELSLVPRHFTKQMSTGKVRVRRGKDLPRFTSRLGISRRIWSPEGNEVSEGDEGHCRQLAEV